MAENIQYILSLKDLFSASIQSANREAEKFEGTMGGIQGTLLKIGGAIGIAFGIRELISFGGEVIDVGSKMETLNNVINYTSINAQDAAANHTFLKRMIDDYKLPIIEATEGFSQMNAALMGSALQGEPARKVFEGVTTAVTAMHLTAAQSTQVFTALNQMVSKGTVQSQELKLQLGNALPGAFQLAAKSMGMTTAAFTKQVEEGKVLSEDFLPKFASALQEKFGGAIPAAIESTTAKMTDMKNSFTEFKIQIFEDLEPAIKSSIDWLKGFGGALKDTWNWFKDHKAVLNDISAIIKVLLISWGSYKLIMWGILAVTKLNVMWQAIQYASIVLLGDGMLTASAMTKLWTGAQVLLNAAITANPIGVIVMAIAAVVTAIILCYNHFAKFRAFLWATWAVIKEFAMIVKDLFTGMWHTIHGLFTFNAKEMTLGGKEQMDAMFNSAKRIAEAAKSGWDAGMADFAKDNPTPGLIKPVTKNGGVTDAAKLAPTHEKGATSKVSGHKTINIRIDIKNLIAQQTIQVTNLKDGVGKMQEEVTKALLSAVNDSQIVAGQ